MRTPAEIAALYAEQFRFDRVASREMHSEIYDAIREAIEADRAQRELSGNPEQLATAREKARVALREWADEKVRGTPHWRVAARVANALAALEEATR